VTRLSPITLRWVFSCRFGRRCGHPVVVSITPPLPEGVSTVIEWKCEGCGVCYRETSG